ncbi:MAG: hypothetical protein JWP75_3112 [Frondihabitans sp.]|nr:hypothetical protein [Frondihabitans sp.]
MTGESVVEAVQAVATAWAVPGGVVVITDREGVVLEHAFGFADRDRGIEVTPDHVFEIGSISKVMTAAVVLQLVESGHLRLTDTAVDILKWLPSALAGSEIMIERLLTHSAGLISGVDAVPDEKAQLGGVSTSPSAAAPGEFFHYSNLGYLLLGQIAARVSGRSLPELVRDGVLSPVGAGRSISTVRHRDRASLAQGYQPRDDDRQWIPGDAQDPAPFLEVAGADGNVACTGRDLAGFARMLLRKGTSDDGQVVLSARSFETMTTRLATGGEDVLVVDGVPPTSESRYGCGINVERSEGRLVLTHGGGMVGYASFLLADVDAGFAVVTLTNANGDGPVAEALARTAAARYAGSSTAAPRPMSSDLWRAPSAGDRPEARPRILSPAMVGVFFGNAGRLEVRTRHAEAGLVRAEVSLGGQTAELHWTWGARILSPLPTLRLYPLEFDGSNWLSGGDVFRPADQSEPTEAEPQNTPDLEAYCGHFRSYTPWFTNFRTVIRHGVLVLVASPGVEAPSEDVILAPLGNGLFRIGQDPRLPERLQFGPAIDGLAEWVDRDGCRYSRSFTP